MDNSLSLKAHTYNSGKYEELKKKEMKRYFLALLKFLKQYKN